MRQIRYRLTVDVTVTAEDHDDAEATVEACIERVHGVMLDDGTSVEFDATNLTPLNGPDGERLA